MRLEGSNVPRAHPLPWVVYDASRGWEEIPHVLWVDSDLLEVAVVEYPIRIRTGIDEIAHTVKSCRKVSIYFDSAMVIVRTTGIEAHYL